MRLTASWECCFWGPRAEGSVRAPQEARPACPRAGLPALSRPCFPLAPRLLRETLVFSALSVLAAPPHATPRGSRTCVLGEHTEDFEFSTDVTSATPGLGEEAAGATLITIPFTLCEWRSCRCQGCLFQGVHDQSASLAQASPCMGSHESVSGQTSNEANSPLVLTPLCCPPLLRRL